MAALSAAANRRARGELGNRFKVPVKATSQIWKGGIVGCGTDGFAVAAVSGANVKVLGIAAESKLGGATDGLVSILVEAGREYLFDASSITQAMLGQDMKVINDNTVDETSASSASVGALTEFVSTTSGWVFVNGLSHAQALSA
jgi:hypothetical protein